jgi:hypothetical protein
MTCRVRHVLTLTTALAVVSSTGVYADQAQTPPPGERTRVTQPDRPSQNSREPSRLHQGFSVVLVVADLQATSATDDVPPAARRALADMKDFLPYKSYKLVDAAWILGQGTGGTSTRLRGPEEQEYELNLHTSRGDASRVSVRFSLRDAGVTEPVGVEARVAVGNRDRIVLEREISRLQEKLNEARRATQEAQVKELRTQLEAAKAQLAEVERGIRTLTSRNSLQTRVTPRPSRTIIDTSFTMEVGETVVVGTSRLKANSKALIALLTAVPAKTSRMETETPR